MFREERVDQSAGRTDDVRERIKVRARGNAGTDGKDIVGGEGLHDAVIVVSWEFQREDIRSHHVSRHQEDALPYEECGVGACRIITNRHACRPLHITLRHENLAFLKGLRPATEPPLAGQPLADMQYRTRCGRTVAIVMNPRDIAIRRHDVPAAVWIGIQNSLVHPILLA